jgi:hypothetical protein
MLYFGASLTEDANRVIYNYKMFTIQATGGNLNLEIISKFLFYVFITRSHIQKSFFDAMTFSLTTLTITTLSIIRLSITTLSIMRLSTTTLSIKGLFVTLTKHDKSDIMLSVFMLNVAILLLLC